MVFKKLKIRFSFHIIAYVILLLVIAFSIFRIAAATTPNPGHPWDEIGDGVFAVTDNQTAVRTYTFPDADATVLTTNATVTVGQGGTGLGTIAAGSVLAANSANVLSAVTSTSGTYVLTNTSGTISWAAGSSGTVTAVSIATANGFSGSSSGGATPALTIVAGAITPTTVNGITFSGSASPTLAVTGTSSISGSNTGDNAANSSTMYIGTTSQALNRASAAEALTGITSIDNGTTGVTIATSTSDKIGFFNATPVAQQSGDALTALSNLGLVTSPTLSTSDISGYGSGYLLATGATTGATSQSQTFTDGVTLNATNIVTDTTTGLKIGTATGQKLGFFNSAPVVQQSGNIITALSNLGLVTSGTITAANVGGTATPTASTIAEWDANVNLSSNNFINGFATTATATGTTTLAVTDKGIQVFTGSAIQTVKLPTTSVAAGQQYTIINQSTGAVTVQSSGSNTITVLAGGTSATFTAVVATPTTAANWNSQYFGDIVASGKSLNVSNSLTLAGTDATTMTFPSTSATIARTDAAQTFTGIQTLSSAPVLSSGTVTVSGNTITFPGSAGTLALNNQTMYIGTTSQAINRASASEGLAGITSLTPGADFTLSQNSVNVLTSVNSGAVANTLYLKAGEVGIGNSSPSALLSVGSTSQFQVDASGNITSSTLAGTGTRCLQASSTGVISANASACGGGGSQTPWTSNIDAAGYTLDGDSVASGNLTLDSTSNSTKGNVIINPSGGNVGIGTTTPFGPLDVESTQTNFMSKPGITTALGVTVYPSVDSTFQNTQTSLTYDNDGHDFLASGLFSAKLGNIDGDNSVGGVVGLASQAEYSGSNAVADGIYGLVNDATIDSGSTPSLVGGLYANVQTGGDVTNNYEISIDDVAQTGGTLTNNFGLAVADQEAGTNNYSIYTDQASGANNYALYNAGDGQSYFGGNVGIGTTTPSEALTVNGSVSNILTSASTAPAVVGTATGFGTDTSVYVSGKYAYVTNLSSGTLSVVDISNPTSPPTVGSVSGVTSASSVYVSGRYAYVTGYATGDLYVIDISNPTSPSGIGGVAGLVSPTSVYVSGRYAYVVNTSDHMYVVDISNPTSFPLSVVGTVTVGGSSGWSSVYVSGRYAYVTNGTSHTMSVVDISNPTSPSVVGTATGLGDPLSVYVSGRYAYVPDNTNGDMYVIDVSDPTSPSVVGTATGLTAASSVSVSGRYAYVAGFNTGDLYAIDISDPTSPSLVSTTTGLGSYAFSISVSGRYAYVTGFSDGTMYVIDLTGTESTSLTAGSGSIGNLQVGNDLLAGGQLQVGGGLTAAGAEFSSSIAVNGDISSSDKLSVGNGASTGPTDSNFEGGTVPFWSDERIHNDLSGDLSSVGSYASYDGIDMLSTYTHTGSGSFVSLGILSAPTITAASTGDISILSGLTSIPTNYGSGSVYLMTGLSVDPTITNGEVHQLAGVESYFNYTSGGIVDNGYGVLIDPPSTGGTLGNNYGLYIEDQSGSGATGDNYNLYSAGAGLNYFGGEVGIGVTSPSALLDLAAGTATAGTAPLKLTAGTNLATTEAGAIEYDGSHLYFTATNGGTRYQLDQQGGSGANALGTYIVQTATNAPANAQVLASLGTGIVKNTTTTGVLSIATAGTDYLAPSGSTYIGTTAHTFNRASGAEALTGITSIDGSAASLTTSQTIWGQSFNGTGAVSGNLTAVGNITGGASSMTITAGTGASRTLALQSTTSGSTATTFLTGNADQSTSFGGIIKPSTTGFDIGTSSLPFQNIYFSGASSTPASNNFEITGTSTSGTRVLTLADGNTTLVAGTMVPTTVASLSSLTTTGTITSGGLGTGATLGAVTMNIASSAVGDMYYAGSSNVLTRLADVATGSVLISGGVTTAPAWSTTPTFVGTNISGTAASLTAGYVTNATLTTALTVNTGTLTLTANSANTSVLTIGAGAVSVSGSNTGDNAANSSTMYIGTTSQALNRASGAEGLAGITSLTPGADFTLSQNSVNVLTSVNSGAVVNTLYLKTGDVGIGVTSPSALLDLAAGTATAGTAPLKFTSGTLLTAPEDGAMEYGSSHLYFTIGSTRYQLDQQGGGSGANALGTYIVQTATNAPTNAQVLASLGTGLLKNTTTTGVLSIATAGTDYLVPSATMYIGTTSQALNRSSASEGLTGITSLTPSADFTLTQNSVSAFTSVESGAVVNTLYLKAGDVGIGTPSPNYPLDVENTANTTNAEINNTYTSSGSTIPVLLVNSGNASGIGSGGSVLSVTASKITGGNGLSVTNATGSSTVGSLISGNLISGVMSTTYTGTGATEAGDLLNLSRSNTINSSGHTYSVTGALATLASSGTQTAGTLADSSNILSLNQNFTGATGTVFAVTNSGTGYAATFSAGNVGIGTTSPSQLLSVGSSNQLTVDSSGDLVSQTFSIGSQPSIIISGTGTGSDGSPNGTYYFKGLLNGANYYQLGSSSWYLTFNGSGTWGICIYSNSSTCSTYGKYFSESGTAPNPPLNSSWSDTTYTGAVTTAAGASSNAYIDGSGDITASGTVTLTGLSGSGTSCVQASSTGVLSVTGSACGGGGGTATPTASTIAEWDANVNLSSNNFINGFATTTTAAGTTTLAVTDKGIQAFTGTNTQTVKLPTTGIVAGAQYIIINNSTGAVTVQSSGANTIIVLAGNTSARLTALVATPTTAANWDSQYFGGIFASGKVVNFSNSLTFAGTDATTMTFPTTNATIARTDAAQTFTGIQTLSSAPVLSSGTVTVSGNTITFPGSAGTLALNNQAMFIGTTSVAINRTSAALTLAGLTLTSPVIATGLTASGSSANDFSASSGTFKTSTGAVTIGSGAISLTGTVSATSATIDLPNIAAGAGSDPVCWTTSTGLLTHGNSAVCATSSDRRLKTDITSLTDSSGLSAIDALTPVSYQYIEPDIYGSGVFMGFIAQDVLPIFPTLVSVGDPTPLTPDGTYALDYQGFIVPAIKAIQELSAGYTLTSPGNGADSTITSAYQGTTLPAVAIDAQGNIQFGNYGAGILMTDAEGNVTASSDILQQITDMNLSLEGIAGTVAPVAGSDTETFVDAFFNNIKTVIGTWLADATNGIADIFATNIHAKNELCINSTCVTEDQLKTLLQNAAAGAGGSTTTTTTTTSSTTSSTDSAPTASQTSASSTDTTTSPPAPLLSGEGGSPESGEVNTTTPSTTTPSSTTDNSTPTDASSADSAPTASTPTPPATTTTTDTSTPPASN